jgi:hypothetical protein
MKDKTISRHSVQTTEAQRDTLEMLPFHQVIARDDSGALVVALDRKVKNWLVLDIDGSFYDFERFLSYIDRVV